MSYDWDLSVLANSSILTALLKGLGVTVLLTFWSILIGTPLGIALGGLACLGDKESHLFGELSQATDPAKVWLRRLFQVIRFATVVAIDVIRAIPLLILILLAFYGLPVLVNRPPIGSILQTFSQNHDGNITISPFQTTVVALIINLSAFVADVVRGAVRGISNGSVLAGRALGMSNWLVWRRIILPDVLREIFPSLTLLWITIYKMSTLASTVAVYEVLHSADAIIQRNYRPLELYLAVGALFVITIVPFSALARKLEGTQKLRRRSL